MKYETLHLIAKASNVTLRYGHWYNNIYTHRFMSNQHQGGGRTVREHTWSLKHTTDVYAIFGSPDYSNNFPVI